MAIPGEISGHTRGLFVAASGEFLMAVDNLRVSTDRQAEKGFGLDVQKRAILAWASHEGHRIVRWCKDEGLSGSNGLEAREGLAEALGAIKRDEAKGVVVFHLDRLARDLILQEQLLVEIRRTPGANLFSTSAAEAHFLSDDPDDPSRKFVRQILGAVSEYESGIIALRLRSGRKRKSERGGFAYGSPPFGYKAKDGELRAEPEEQATLARIVELRGGGSSLREICCTLENEGRLTKRGGARWHPAVVRDVIARSVRSA